MPLFTKSAQLPVDENDGVRVCVMRRPDENIKWDIWMPHLAPSHKLLTAYHKQEVDWSDFCDRFESDVLKGEEEYILILSQMAIDRNVTIICWEDEPAMCHRRLVAEKCKELVPKLEVHIR